MTNIVCFIIVAVLVACDQMIKFWAVNSLAPVGTISVISGVLNFTYVENRGAAFGIFTGQRTLLILLVSTILCGACWLLVSGKAKTRLERLCVVLIVSGGLGNLIDRIRLGFVVDYIDINPLFSYPMFNLADCCVVTGAVLLVVLVLLEEKKKARSSVSEEKNKDVDTDSSNS